ncbi:aminotransferase class V-fold PLP-dependent enzyme [Nocardiopsis sp. FR26]|uniref:aminotransferase class V-fold PLP-dependent enzyme n=1 Tax=Nocardiopsis sp. FR26 TaxID=2605987 RepID=UPI0013598BF3|nr:aminotransferase class V-fold PLP-dependent enzyme [Nocardiopsis sp. FR26]
MDDSHSTTRVPLALRDEFSPQAAYLDTATHGLLPRRSRRALEEHARDLAEGRFHPADADPLVDRVRAAYARLVGVSADDVAVGTHVAQFVGAVAASLPPGAHVLTATGEFTSLTFPLMARQEHGVRVREVPLADLAGEVGLATSLVAVSAVQSATGQVAPLEDLRAACAEHGTRLLVDTTQAAGWLPLDASRVDYTVCSTFKWLLGTRGAALLTAAPGALAALRPPAANWYAGEDRWSSLYGGPLRLAEGARRLDLPPVWSAWITLERSLALLEEVGTAAVHAHNTALGDRLRRALDLEPAGSAIVSVPVPEGALERVAAAGVRTAARDGRLRAAFHLYNDASDVDRLVGALRG